MPHPEIKRKDITAEIQREVATRDGVMGKGVEGRRERSKTLLKKDDARHPSKERGVGRREPT